MKEWIAVVACEVKPGRLMMSFMVLPDSSRFLAIKNLESELPGNPEYIDETGKLKPYTLIELKHVYSRYTENYRQAFVEMLHDMLQKPPPNIRFPALI